MTTATANTFAGLLEGFFTRRLMQQQRASPHTIASYRDTFRLLLKYMHKHFGTSPCKLAFEQLDAVVITCQSASNSFQVSASKFFQLLRLI